MKFINLKIKKSQILIFMFFVILFLFGILFLPKIGQNFDELSEQVILQSNIKEYLELFGSSLADDMWMESISNNIEMDHGISPYYLFSPIFFMNLSNDTISNFWHLYTYIIFFVSLIYIYKLIKYLYKKENISLLGSLLYFLSPRLFIDSFHNNKDIVLLSLLVIMIYYGIRLIDKKKIRFIIPFCFISAMVCNIKIIGFYFLFLIFIMYVVDLVLKKQLNKKNILICLFSALLILLIFFIITPAIWGSGKFELINYIKYCSSNTIDFRNKTATVLFEGNYYNTMTNPLPWYYLIKMILITLPIIIIIFFVGALILLIVNIIKCLKSKKIDDINIIYILLLFFMWLIPMLIFIFMKPNIYNGWRHFYFLYALIVIIGSYFLNYIFSQRYKLIKIITIFMISISLCYSLFCIVKYDVANVAYFNPLMRNVDIEQKYELDYYGVTAEMVLNDFLDKYVVPDDDGKIYLYGKGFQDIIVKIFALNYNGEWKDKLVILDDDNYILYLLNGKKIYLVCNNTYTFYINFNRYELIYSYKWFDEHLMDIYVTN